MPCYESQRREEAATVALHEKKQVEHILGMAILVD